MYNLHLKLLNQVKILYCKIDGIFCEERIDIPFLYHGSLFNSIKNNLNQKNAERKICEFLAIIGVSI